MFSILDRALKNDKNIFIKFEMQRYQNTYLGTPTKHNLSKFNTQRYPQTIV
jgi:hypothetical protein